VLLNHSLALLNGESREGEHANLGRDMRPVSLDALLLDGRAEGCAHIIHSSADNHELVEPLLAHLRIIQDSSRNSGAMLGRRRVVGPDNDFDLREDFLGGTLISTDEVEASGTLTVQTHDLGEGLSNDHLEALVKEEAKAIGILVERA